MKSETQKVNGRIRITPNALAAKTPRQLAAGIRVLVRRAPDFGPADPHDFIERRLFGDGRHKTHTLGGREQLIDAVHKLIVEQFEALAGRQERWLAELETRLVSDKQIRLFERRRTQ